MIGVTTHIGGSMAEDNARAHGADKIVNYCMHTPTINEPNQCCTSIDHLTGPESAKNQSTAVRERTTAPLSGNHHRGHLRSPLTLTLTPT